MKKTTLLLIVSMLLMLAMTACGRECTCDYNCSNTVVSNSEIEATPQTTLEPTSDPEEIELEFEEDEEELEFEEEEDDEAEKKIKEKYEKERAEKEKIYHKAKKLYRSGKWDGKPMKLQSRTVSFNQYGQICVDGENVMNRRVDLPDNIYGKDLDSELEYIPGEGVFAFQDTTLVKYVRGKKVKLGTFKYKGLNPQHPEKYGCQIIDGRYYPPDYDKDGPNGDNSCMLEWPGPKPRLYYDQESKKLLFITYNPIKEVKYLYVFTDYNRAKAKCLGEINVRYCVSSCFPDGKTHLEYGDMEGNSWVWCKNGPMLYEEFEKKCKKK